MPLTLRLRETHSIPLEVDTIRMETVREQSARRVAQTLVQYGNRQLPAGEFFDIGGKADDETIVWEGDCSRVKYIAARLQRGHVRVEGHAGMHLGAEMSGGHVLVTGQTGDWLGAEMRGGRIEVHGDGGHLVGAAYRGARRGMTGGEILIRGDAGDETGQRMRRGLIVIGGRCGALAGMHMIAGSILLFGPPGARLGAGMKRGTIVLFDNEHLPRLLPTFRHAGRLRPTFLRLYLKQLSAAGFPVPDAFWECSYDRYCGDFLEIGHGEVLCRAAV